MQDNSLHNGFDANGNRKDHALGHEEGNSTRLTRNAERTRAAVLEAAAEAMTERGTGVSLEQIAKRAGVTKGGLLHHFPSKEALIVAMVEDAHQRLRSSVLAHLDLSENTPGKLLRAYVRALTSGSEDALRYFTASPAWAGIYQIPQVAQAAEAEAQWWAENLAADGLEPKRIHIAQRAAEGVAAAVAYGDETLEAAQETGRALIELIDSGSVR